jgi:hypothetical protein
MMFSKIYPLFVQNVLLTPVLCASRIDGRPEMLDSGGFSPKRD